MWAGQIPIGNTYVFVRYYVKGEVVVMVGQSSRGIGDTLAGFVQGLLFY